MNVFATWTLVFSSFFFSWKNLVMLRREVSEMKFRLQVGTDSAVFQTQPRLNQVLAPIRIQAGRRESHASFKTNKHRQRRFLWTKSICAGMSGLFRGKGK